MCLNIFLIIVFDGVLKYGIDPSNRDVFTCVRIEMVSLVFVKRWFHLCSYRDGFTCVRIENLVELLVILIMF